MGYIYVLSLVDNKFYVGYSDNFLNRIEQHFESSGSAWTKKYPVIKVLKIKEGTKQDEALVTRKLMTKHGVDNVRGGPWCRIILDTDPFDYNPELYGDHMNDRCYKCGHPGHYAVNCFAKAELICENCGKRGHYTNQCYVKKISKKKCEDSPTTVKKFKTKSLKGSDSLINAEKLLKTNIIDTVSQTNAKKFSKKKTIVSDPTTDDLKISNSNLIVSDSPTNAKKFHKKKPDSDLPVMIRKSLKKNASTLDSSDDNNEIINVPKIKSKDNPIDRCYKCGRTGHYANECFAKTELRCDNCGKKGHYGNQCYTKKKISN